MNKIQIISQLWQLLWQDYSKRVEYARIYQQMIEEAGGTIANDHIAFRSLRLTIDRPERKINLGIPYVADVIKALGYELAGEYTFLGKYLYAHHYRHPEQDRFDLPKLFISELIVDALPTAIAQQIEQAVISGNLFNLSAFLQQLETASNTLEKENILTQLQELFIRPWQPPKLSVVESVNAVSQYGAWVLLHGYAVNHFTGYVNRQHTSLYPDIETTARGLAAQGIPMKERIEGSVATGLRQTATQAVTEMVTIEDDNSGELRQIPWTYAYYEIAQRNAIAVGNEPTQLFEGFLTSQAQNLFEMTRKS